MVKEFHYRGKQLADLQALQPKALLELFNARQRRSISRGLTDGKRKVIDEIKATKAGTFKNPIKTHLRDLIVLPNMVGVTVNVYSGKEFKPVALVPEMIGHHLGEYVITNKRVTHGAPGVGASRSSLYVPLK